MDKETWPKGSSQDYKESRNQITRWTAEGTRTTDLENYREAQLLPSVIWRLSRGPLRDTCSCDQVWSHTLLEYRAEIWFSIPPYHTLGKKSTLPHVADHSIAGRCARHLHSSSLMLTWQICLYVPSASGSNSRPSERRTVHLLPVSYDYSSNT